MESQNEGESHENEQIELPPRTRQPPAALKDFCCYAASINLSCATPNANTSSVKVYHISNFIIYDHFSYEHLAYITALNT